MASSPIAPAAPSRVREQKNLVDRALDRKTKTSFHVFTPFPEGGDFSSILYRTENAIAAAVNGVNRELFSQLTDDINGSELKFCTRKSKSKTGEACLFTKFELYSSRAVELFRSAFPINRRASNPAAENIQYSWPGSNTQRQPQRQQAFTALSIRGGQKFSFDDLKSAFQAVGVTLCSSMPQRGRGLKAVSLYDSLAIIKTSRPPRSIKIGDRSIYISIISPVDPSTVNPATGSSADASNAAPPPAEFQIQAWLAIQEARSKASGKERPATKNNGGAPVATATEGIAATGTTTSAPAADNGNAGDAAGDSIAAAGEGEENQRSVDAGSPMRNGVQDTVEDVGAEEEVPSPVATCPEEKNSGGAVAKPTGEVVENRRRSPRKTPKKTSATPRTKVSSPTKRKARSPASKPASTEPPMKSPRKLLAALKSPNRGISPTTSASPQVLQLSFAAVVAGDTPPGSKKAQVTKLAELLPLWDKIQADVVLIQEHHLRFSDVSTINNFLSSRPDRWIPVWRYNLAGASSSNRGSAGVAFLFRSRLIRDGLIKFDGIGATIPDADTIATVVKSWAPSNCEDGRSISVNFTWAGHKIMLACVYLPSYSAPRAEFMRSRLVPMKQFAAAKGKHLIMAGDFNFVHTPSLDRLTVSGGEVTIPTSRAEDQASDNEWNRHPELSSLVDVWRSQHPTGRYLSRMQCGSAARLDRFYLDAEISTYAACPSTLPRKALSSSLFRSDHAPVMCCLMGRSRPDTPSELPGSKRKPRLNLSFMKNQLLVDEFADWLESILESMPSDDNELFRWWIKFKNKALRNKIYNLNGDYFRECNSKLALDKLTAALDENMHALNGSDDDARLEAMARYPSLKSEIAAAEAELEAFRLNKERRVYFHQKERPSRAMSYALLQRQRDDIAALQDRSGVVHTSRSKCASIAIDFWAEISSQPETTAEARAQVLAALAADNLPQIEATVAEQLGSPIITEAEMLQTLKKSSPHTAPGPDGISMKLYKRFKAQFAPMLAAVFSAFGTLERVPKRFLDSVITHIFKAGRRHKIENYRPISLTNTEYRLLARTLAGRAGSVLQNVIDPAQTAFLPGRNIGDNAMLLQLLPAWLNQQNRSGFIAFCDFRKAYDTIDRQFLFEAAATLGLGPGFIKWMKLLLTDTRSAAIVDGYLSDYRKMMAGVRQGCPLAPLIYLIVAQAALSWLRSKGIGITVLSELLTAGQHADDLKVLLEGLEQVPEFVQHMKTFALATGQHMLEAKTKILPIGKPPQQDLPDSIEGLPVVSTAKALGLTYKAFTGEISVDWDVLIKRVHDRVRSITKCKLSPFGRAFAVNGYAFSRVLFAAQFVGLPEGSKLEFLQRMVAAAVDSETCLRLPGEPGPRQHHFTHVGRNLLVGHPRHGGMGLMDLPTQVTAMRQKWACRFLTGNPKSPWIKIARAVLDTVIERSENFSNIPYTAPRLHFLCAVWELGLDNYFSPRNGHIPSCLRHMADALSVLPRPKLLAHLVPGPWCANIPLWSNPLLLDSNSQPMEHSASALALFHGRGMASVRDLLQARLELETVEPSQFFLIWKDLTYPGRPAGCPLDSIPHSIFRQHRTKEAVAALLDAAIVEVSDKLSDSWIAAASYSGTATVADTEDLILSSLGWTFKKRKETLSNLTVKMGYLVQVSQRQPPQMEKFIEYANLISPETTSSSVQRMLARIWSRPCCGHDFAPLWYLVLNGVATAERMDLLAEASCGCQTSTGPTRVHVFFECPILHSLLQSVQKQFSGEWASPQLDRHHIWLATKPHRKLHQGVWDIVVVFIIKSFDAARRNWTDRVLKAQRRQRQPQRSSRAAGSRHRPAMPPGPEMVNTVGAIALTEFWGNLADFIAINTLPSQWLSQVPLDHPFFHPDPERRTWIMSRQE